MTDPILRTDIEAGSSGARGLRHGIRAVATQGRIPALVLALALAYFIDPNPRLDFSTFDTRDAESYLALSQSLVAGHGYTRSLDPNFYVPHTTWPPGLPLLLTPFVAVAQMPIDLLVIKLGMIFYGAVGILLAYLYARRASPRPIVQLSVPLLLGLNPYYWQFSRMTDTEMPTVLWVLIALLLADIGWAKGRIRYDKALLFGLVAGFGMLIRGSFLPALFLPLVYLTALRTGPSDLRRMGSRYLAYAFGFLLPFVVWHVRNGFIDSRALGQDGINQLAMILRTVPVDPASPLRSASQILSDMRANIAGSVIYQIPKSLIPGLWDQAVWDRIGAASAPIAIAASLAAVIVSCLSIRNLPLIVVYGSMAALNVFYAAGGMPRLWVPVTCLIAISLPFGIEGLLGKHLDRAAVPALAALAAGVLSVSTAFYIIDHDRHPYHDPAYAALADMFKTVREQYRLDGNVLTPNPQAFGLYTGLKAPPSVPGIGLDPHYDYVILPSVEWNEDRLRGTLIAQNSVWSLIALSTPLRIDELRERYDCTHSSIPAMSVLSLCLIS
jgi:Dolichyl-phosphate-mannose-protein mannosyltransferase